MISKLPCLLLCLISFTTYGQFQEGPVVLGWGLDEFTIGEILYEDPLDEAARFASDWVVQMHNQGKFERYALIKEGKLEVLDPAGCTIWFREKLQGPLCITYKVKVPSARDTANIIRPRDINNFWMAGISGDVEGILDTAKYSGKFSDYHGMQGYYASMGGGSLAKNNRTVRMRIYPRMQAGEKCKHIALIDQDDNPDFKIQSNKEYKIQLVAYHDLIQFIVNEELVYQMRYGMPATATVDNRAFFESSYTAENNPIYTEGYFGFRMTHSMHQYYDFKVHRLLPRD